MDNNQTIVAVAWLAFMAAVLIFMPESKCPASPLKLERQNSLFRGDIITPDRIKPCLDCGPNQTAKTLELDDKVNIRARWTVHF